MAKPVDNVDLWAKDGTYTNGPYAGLANTQAIPAAVSAEGFIPGAANPSAAEHVNDYLQKLSALARWVFDGSNAADKDAHIVETDGTGRATLYQLDVTPDDSIGWGIRVQAAGVFGDLGGLLAYPNPFVPAIRVICSDGDATGVRVDGAAGAACMTLNPAGVGGKGLRITSPDDGFALEVFGAVDYPAIDANGDGAGAGVDATGGATGHGVIARGGATSGDGLRGLSQSASGAGVRGETDAAAGILAGGVVGVGYGDGNGVIAFAEDGWALVVDAPGGDKAAVLIDHRSGFPSNSTDGQISIKNDDAGTGYHFLIHSGEWRGVHSTRHGWCGLLVTGSDLDNINTSSTTISPTSFGGLNAPKQVGKVEVTYVAEVGRTGTCAIDITLRDETLGVNFYAETMPLYQSGGGVYERTVTCRAVYTLPAAGDRTFRVDIGRNGGGGGDVVRVRNQVLTVRGVFD